MPDAKILDDALTASILEKRNQEKELLSQALTPKKESFGEQIGKAAGTLLPALALRLAGGESGKLAAGDAASGAIKSQAASDKNEETLNRELLLQQVKDLQAERGGLEKQQVRLEDREFRSEEREEDRQFQAEQREIDLSLIHI